MTRSTATTNGNTTRLSSSRAAAPLKRSVKRLRTMCNTLSAGKVAAASPLGLVGNALSLAAHRSRRVSNWHQVSSSVSGPRPAPPPLPLTASYMMPRGGCGCKRMNERERRRRKRRMGKSTITRAKPPMTSGCPNHTRGLPPSVQ